MLLAGAHHLVERGLEEVDRNEHVARQLFPRRERVHHEEGAHADELAVLVDERGAAVVEARRRSEDRSVDQVLPVARELALGDDGRDRDRLLRAAGDDHEAVELRDRCRCADADRFRRDRRDRANEPESRGVIVRDHGARHRLPVGVGDFHLVCLEDEIADGEDEALAIDHHARAEALGAERLVAARIGERFHLDADDRIRRFDQVLIRGLVDFWRLRRGGGGSEARVGRERREGEGGQRRSREMRKGGLRCHDSSFGFRRVHGVRLSGAFGPRVTTATGSFVHSDYACRRRTARNFALDTGLRSPV